jgi:O-antigen/teichoic acid export membrane protein
MKIKPRLPAVLQEAWSDGLLSFLLQKASGSFFVKVSGAALGFGGEIVLARLTSLSEYGIYIYVWTWISLLAIPATLGFRGALVQLVSKYREKEDWPRLRGILRRSNQFTILAAVGIGALVAFGSLRFPELWENPKTSAMMALGMVALPFAALTINQRGALQGFKQVIWADVPYLILRRILLIGGAAGVWLWLGELTAQEIILALAAALFLAYAVAQYRVWKQIPTAVRDEPLVFEGAKWMYTAIPFLLLSGANLVQNKADILMIGPLVGVEQAGIYGAATRLKMLIAFGLNAANMIVAPMISEYYSAGKRKQMQQLIAIGSAGVFLSILSWQEVSSLPQALGCSRYSVVISQLDIQH